MLLSGKINTEDEAAAGANGPAAEGNPDPAAGTPAAGGGVRPRFRRRSGRRRGSGRLRSARQKAAPPAQPDLAVTDILLAWGRPDRTLPEPQALPDPTASADTVALAEADAQAVADTPPAADTTALPDVKAPADTKALTDAQALPAVELLPAEPASAGLIPADASGGGLIRTEVLDESPGGLEPHYARPVEGGLDYTAGPAYRGGAYAGRGDGPPDTTGAAGPGQGGLRPGQAEAGPGVAGQPGSDQSEPEDLDPDRPVSGRLIPIGLLSGSGRLALAGTAPDLPTVRAATAPSAAAWLAEAGQAAQDWASRQSIGLSSACGVSIALAVCAAGWFSAGTRTDILRGVGAAWAGYLALKAGQFISDQRQVPKPPQPAASQQRRGSEDGVLLASPVAVDIAAPVILEPGPGPGPRPPQPSRDEQPSGAQWGPGVAEPAETQRGHLAGAGRIDALRRPDTAAGWLAALGGCLAESVVYLGLAVGAAAQHWGRAWPCAIAVVGLVAVRNLMTACSTLPWFGDHPEGNLRRVCAAALAMPAGGRILLIGVVAPLWGARAALLAMLEWAIISVAYGLAGRTAAGGVASGEVSSSAASSDRTSLVLRLRDDGALARTLGTLVRGSLLPLPPAVLGLMAVSALAVLGLHGLPGALMIAPAAVMLLAAPGSAHPHAGRFDWLVPSLLLGAQVLYLTAVGLGARVPEPVIFVLVVALLMRYTDLAFPVRPVMLAKPRSSGGYGGERGTALGWEGRLLVAGVAAALGIATFAYLALTAYLGLLICAKVVVSSQTPREVDRS